MKRGLIKQAGTGILILCLVFISFTGFSYQSGLGEIHLEKGYQIFETADYKEYTANNSKRGLVRAQLVTADLQTGLLIPFVYTGEVSRGESLDSMVETVEANGYKVVAGINGDIFDTSSSSPRGTVIHKGNIITSGYQPDRILTFGTDNKLSMKNVSLKYSFTSLVKEEIMANISYFNVPDGGGGGVFLYNRNYGPSTKTSGDRIEVIIEVEDMQLKVNKEIEGLVKDIKNTGNTTIGDNQLILSVSKASPSYNLFTGLEIGETVLISCQDETGDLVDAVEALGLYHSIVEDGQIVTSGSNVNPRTAVGLKKDGKIILYVADGRQATVSNGLTIEELAQHMLDLGCIYAWNMDGGGSSQMVVRKPGEETKATLKNSPSEGSARKVSNGLLLVYKEKGDKQLAHIHSYADRPLLLKGESARIKTYGTNRLFEKISITDELVYSNDKYGSMNGNIFTSDAVGKTQITSKYGDFSSQVTVETVDRVNVIPDSNKWTLSPGASKKATARVAYGVVAMTDSKPEFTFSCDQAIGSIDKQGNFKANLVNKEVTGKISILYGSEKGEISVTINPEELKIVEFSDTFGHWAKDYIGVLAALGKASGVGDNMFMPDGSISRAQFVAFLAKATDGIDVSVAEAAGFTDLGPGEWSYNYVNWAYQEGIVKGMGDKIFKPNDTISREQMAVMLCNYAVYQGYALPQKEEAIKDFSDRNKISSWARDYVYTVVGSGIMNGVGDNKFAPLATATRGQAAKIIYEYLDTKEGINFKI